ncbi:MAG: hypothetical protein HXS54_12520 [Theionarchaea archaeon]|nr:hypothetical protein [Theionarchaea archaeon]
MTTIQDASVYLRTEPRIWLIKRQLEQILKLVDLEKDGKVVDVDGFRLKNLSQWADHKSSLYSDIGSVSGYCNADCILSYTCRLIISGEGIFSWVICTLPKIIQITCSISTMERN